MRKAADQLGMHFSPPFRQTPQELCLLRKRYGNGAASMRRRPDCWAQGDLAHAGCATDEELKVLAATGTHVANCALALRGRSEFSLCALRACGREYGHRHRFPRHGHDRRTARHGLLSKQHFGKAHVGTAHQLMRAGTLAGANALGRPTGPAAGWREGRPARVRPLQSPSATGMDPVKNLIWKATPATSSSPWSTASRWCVRAGCCGGRGDHHAQGALAARKIWDLAAQRKILPPPPVLQ
jgi:hypothetical protein